MTQKFSTVSSKTVFFLAAAHVNEIEKRRVELIGNNKKKQLEEGERMKMKVPVERDTLDDEF